MDDKLKRVNVLLRPTPTEAERTLDVRAIWGGQIRLEGVPVGGT